MNLIIRFRYKIKCQGCAHFKVFGTVCTVSSMEKIRSPIISVLQTKHPSPSSGKPLDLYVRSIISSSNLNSSPIKEIHQRAQLSLNKPSQNPACFPRLTLELFLESERLIYP